MYLRLQTFNLYYIMALTLGGLEDLTGLFPGATQCAAGTTPSAAYSGPAVPVGNGYIAIPLQSIKYTGSEPNRWTIGSLGSGNAATPAAGSSMPGLEAASVTGSFRKFARGMCESLYNYTTGSLTGTNAYTYWGQSAGSYSVYNATTLSKSYSTTLYYEIGDSVASKPDVS